MGDAFGVGFGGILGLPVLGNLAVTIDYRGGTIRFEYKKPSNKTRGAFTRGRPCFQIRAAVYAGFETGAGASSRLEITRSIMP